MKKICIIAAAVIFSVSVYGTMAVRFLEDNIISLNLTSAAKIGLTIPEDLIEEDDNLY